MAFPSLPPNAPDTKVSNKAPVASGPSGGKMFTGTGMSMFTNGQATVQPSGTKGDVAASDTPNPVRAGV
jgi:hypothetical protein